MEDNQYEILKVIKKRTTVKLNDFFNFENGAYPSQDKISEVQSTLSIFLDEGYIKGNVPHVNTITKKGVAEYKKQYRLRNKSLFDKLGTKEIIVGLAVAAILWFVPTIKNFVCTKIKANSKKAQEDTSLIGNQLKHLELTTKKVVALDTLKK